MFDLAKPIASLAPMDGITDSAFRRIVRKLNPDILLFSEFTSINGIQHSDKVKRRLLFKPEELPYIVQVFGNDPELFKVIIKEIEPTGITGIDINMGCPAKKVIKSNAGGYLMKEKELAYRIVEACVKTTKLPISVKTRIGWSDAEELIDFTKGLVDAGAQMISVHGRTFGQGYKGLADWEKIYQLKDEVSAIIIGNGDLKGRDQALQKLRNLDGFMIGRAAIGNPWVFWSDEKQSTVAIGDKISTMIEHFQYLRENKAERVSLIEFRKHIGGYIKGIPGAKSMRALLMQCKTEKEFLKTAVSVC